jgi:hypothetical protein
MPARKKEVFKELYVGIIGWAWMVTCVAALYFLVRAIFYYGSWWYFFGSGILAWLLYRVSLHQQLEKEHALRESAKAAAISPDDRTEIRD